MAKSGVGHHGTVRVGISGWTYPPWRGGFYPKGLRQADELGYAARQFATIEINGTFYGLQKPAAFAAWREAVPEDFVFTVKAPRFITHVLRLRDCATPLANFMASGLLGLGDKLGPILWQFPPNFRAGLDQIEEFLAMLPHDGAAAEELAARHDFHVDGRCLVKAGKRLRLHHAMEIRNERYASPEFVTLLRKYRVSLVCADTEEWPRLMDATGDVVYCRLHGDAELYRSGYDDAALDLWTKRVVAWTQGKKVPKARYAGGHDADQKPRDVFLFFDNTDKKRAPVDAAALVERLRKRGVLARARPEEKA